MKKLQGIFSALLVPYNDDGRVNEEGLRQTIRHNIDQIQVDGLYVGGSTGENFLIDTQTKKQIFQIAFEETKHEVQLIAQVGSTNLHEAIELAQYVKQLGYTTISAVTPFYYKFSFPEVKAYYNALVDACDLDLVIYSIPFLTGVNINVQQFGELYENPKIIGVKFTAADFYLLERLRQAFPNHLIFSGFDEMLLPAVVNGVDGAIGSTFNLKGDWAKKIFTLAQNNQIPEALALQHRYNDYVEDVLNNGLYQTLKELLALHGVSGQTEVRAPMAQLTDVQKDQAKVIFNKYFSN